MTVAAQSIGSFEPPEATVPEPIDWALAGRIARRVVGTRPARHLLSRGLARVRLRRGHRARPRSSSPSSPASARRARPGPSSSTAPAGSTPTSARCATSSRRSPTRVGERIARSPFAPIGRTVTATELGVLLGWFSQRVLGQYDLLVPSDDDDGAIDDAVYYVGANVLALEKRYAFWPRDFRLWIALHECTHRAQFTGVPWLRPYFLSLVERPARLDRPRPEARRHRGAHRARGDAARPQPARRRRPRRAARHARAPRHDRQGAVADDAARGPRQPRDERARRAPRPRAGAHGARARGPAPHRRHHRVLPQAHRPRGQVAPVRGGGGVRRRDRSARPARARSTPRGAVPSGSRPPTSSRTRRAGSRASPDASPPACVHRRPHVRTPTGSSGSTTSRRPVVVACSGGPDSLALLALAAAADLAPVAVYVDHGLRAESADDGRVVARRRASSSGSRRDPCRCTSNPAPTSRPARATRATPRSSARATRGRRGRRARRAHRRRPGRDRAAEPVARERAAAVSAAWPCRRDTVVRPLLRAAPRRHRGRVRGRRARRPSATR